MNILHSYEKRKGNSERRMHLRLPPNQKFIANKS